MTSIEYLKKFENIVSNQFTYFLSRYGFQIERHESDIQLWGTCSFTFCKDQMRIAITLSCLQQDYSNGINVIIWTGKNYATGLKFVVQHLTDSKSAKLYNHLETGVEECVSEIMHDLEIHLKDFLNGDVKTYTLLAALGQGLK